MKKRIGWLEKQYPITEFEDTNINGFEIKDLKAVFKPNENLLNFSTDDNAAILIKANEICEDKFTYFSNFKVELNSIEWNKNYFNSRYAPKNIHWSKISDLNSDFGDIKLIWELARFSFMFPLAQAYYISKDEKYSAKIWELFNDFYDNNKPEMGIHYKCGQEMSLRVFAIIYAVALTSESHSFNSFVEKKVAHLVVQHTNHIYKHINFSVESVKNNHSISEATCLYIVGSLFNKLSESNKWISKGKRILEKEVGWQIYDDGSYIQHSHNYHRLVIQNLTLVEIVNKYKNIQFSKNFYRKCIKTLEFLIAHCEKECGRIPNYGMNDGAYILPLTSKGYLDYRPSLNAFSIALNRTSIYPKTELLDMAYWLGLEDKHNVANKAEVKSEFFSGGGYLVSIKDNQRLYTRCATYKHRPVQADMLHIDFWVGPHNILSDAGTYSYNTNFETIRYFNGGLSHNSLFFDGKDQMLKGERFIWYNWTRSKVLKCNLDEVVDEFSGTHYGYKPIEYIRSVKHVKNKLIIEDEINNNSSLKEFQYNLLLGVDLIIDGPLGKIDLGSHGTWNLSFESDSEYKITRKKMKRSLYYNSYEEESGINILFQNIKKENIKLKITLVKEEEANE